MYRIGFFLFLSFFLLNACENQTQNQQFGEVDLAQIAEDTLLQNTIEESFEFVKDLPFQNKEVYAIVNGGYTGFRDVLITKRKTITLYDTLATVSLEDERVVNAFLTDLDNNGSPEIHVIVKKSLSNLEFDKVLVLSKGKWIETAIVPDYKEFNVVDNHFWTPKKDVLIHQFMISDAVDSLQKGQVTRVYKLKNNIFALDKMETTL